MGLWYITMQCKRSAYTIQNIITPTQLWMRKQGMGWRRLCFRDGNVLRQQTDSNNVGWLISGFRQGENGCLGKRRMDGWITGFGIIIIISCWWMASASRRPWTVQSSLACSSLAGLLFLLLVLLFVRLLFVLVLVLKCWKWMRRGLIGWIAIKFGSPLPSPSGCPTSACRDSSASQLRRRSSSSA